MLQIEAQRWHPQWVRRRVASVDGHREVQGNEPWIQGRGRAERSQDEGALVDFAIILAAVLARAEGTAKQKTIRHQ
eukprot:8646961-Pyramimonas_sp.AAC.1